MLQKFPITDEEEEGPTDRDKLVESAFHTEMCEVPDNEEVVQDDLDWKSSVRNHEISALGGQSNYKSSAGLASHSKSLESYNNNLQSHRNRQKTAGNDYPNYAS